MTDIVNPYDFSSLISFQLYSSGTHLYEVGMTNVNSPPQDGVLVVFDQNGMLDSTFSGNGIVLQAVASSQTTIFTTVTSQVDGKILVGGNAGVWMSGPNPGFIERLNADGSIDTLFGVDGIAWAPVAGAAINSVRQESNGNIIVTASGWASPILCYELLPDGSLNTNFGLNGAAILDSFQYTQSTITIDDKILVIGGSSSFRLEMLNSDGTPDLAFGYQGLVNTIVNDGYYIGAVGGAIAGSIAGGLLPNGDILVVGNAPNTQHTDSEITIIAYKLDGSIDYTFGENGVVQSGLVGNDNPTSMIVDANGSIFVAGNHEGNGVILKYLSGGVADSSFNSNLLSQMPEQFMQGHTVAANEISNGYAYRPFSLFIESNGYIGIQGRGSTNFALFDTDGNLVQTAFQGSGLINGTGVSDSLIGSLGDDVLNGADGADVLIGGSGNDTINGGTGVDTADFSDATTAVVVNLNAGTATGDGTDTLTGIENAVGGSGNDTLTANNTTGSELDGGAGSDTLNGGAVADVLYGGDGNDIVNAGAGNDLIIGGDGAGNDAYNGGDGIDTVKYTSALAGITVDLSTSTGTATSTAGNDASHIGNDTLTGIENIIAGNYNDILTGSSLDNAFTGESGNDTINGGTGNDTAIYQGTKSQYTITNNSNGTWTVADTVDGRDGIDTISNIEYLQFTDQTFALTVAPPQTLTGTSKADTLTGGAGNDILIGLAGTDTLNGQDGSDLYVMTSTSDHKAAEINDTGTSGSDEVRFTTTTASTLNLYALDRGIEAVTIGTGTAASAVTTGTTANNINAALVANALSIIGNDGNNTLTGTAYADTLTGNAGNDTLNGGAGVDTLIGGDGNDTYVVDNTGDVVTETNALTAGGTDLVQVAISTAAGTYTLGSNLENATLTNTVAYNLTGNSLNNTLTGNAANNTLDGGAGTDTLVGGAGNDTYLVDIITASGALEDTLTEAASAGTDTIQLRGSYSGALANLTLATNFENLDISNTGSSLYNLTGNSANNILTGNAANNTLNGGTGTDTLIGGLGNDTYVVDNVSDTVTEYADQGTDTIQSSVTFSLANFIESLTLTGTSAINGTGNTLDNTITGNSGVNTLNGGDGNDSLSGLAGNDVLNGGNGNDILSGGAGSDNLTGGAGVDHFVFDTALNATTNKDTITDFTHGTDKIDLQNLVMTALGGTEGALSTNQFWSGAGVVKGHDGDDRVVYNTTTGALYYDADGSGSVAAVQFAILGATLHPTMTYQDFWIV